MRLSFRSPTPLLGINEDRLRFFTELARGIKLPGDTFGAVIERLNYPTVRAKPE